ncbi:MAG TPA: MFS transporter [Verrucomicrobiae bacterium]|nr:MFS transporter [Verrucomicrobiae bacterium]
MMVGFAFAATVINYLDRSVLGLVAASPGFKESVHLTDEAYGNIGAAFMLAYAISNGLSGTFIDTVGTRIGYVCCMAWWSLASILHAFVRGPLSLGCCQFLLGTGEAGNWPAAAKMVSEWFPAKERALASGIFNAGASIGAVISPLVIVWVVTTMGWRSSFVLMGTLGLLWGVCWWLTHASLKNTNTPATAQRQTVPVAKLLRTRFVMFFTLSKVFMDPVWYFLLFWFPKYLAEVHHFSMKEIGWKGGIPYFTAAIGNLAGGFLASRLIRHGLPTTVARKASTTVFALLMTCIIPAIFTSNAPLAIAFISITTFGYTGYTANTLAFPADIFPKQMVASVWGFASMGSGFGGMLFMALSGWGIGHYGYMPVFIGYGILPLLALICILFLIGPLRSDVKFQPSKETSDFLLSR